MERPPVPAGSASHRPAATSTPPGAVPIVARLRAWTPWIATLVRLGLAVVWAWAARAKILEPDGAVVSVRAYRLLPEALVHPVAWGLPFLELALAVLLAAGVATRLAATTSAGARGLSIDCGCFSAGGPAAGVGAAQYLGEVLRDTGLLVVSLALA